MSGDDPLQEIFDAEMARLMPEPWPAAIGVAVSGGSDSTTLMHLAACWGQAHRVAVHVATVDHKLRPESSAEAEGVARSAAALGLSHATLPWEGWDRNGNLQNAARQARRTLLAEWAVETGVPVILLGHTSDDQLETLFMNLSRGSGLSGLTGIAHRARLLEGRDPWLKDLWLLRPLIKQQRKTLQSWLTDKGIGWLDDPSNQDQRFKRSHLRKALEQDAATHFWRRMTETRERLARAQRAVEAYAQEVGRRIAQVHFGDVLFEREGLLEAEDEIRMHLFSHALSWITGLEHRPRALATERAFAEMEEGKGGTLHGCIWRIEGDRIRVFREVKAVGTKPHGFDGRRLWDRRWLIEGPSGTDLRALGPDGWAQMKAQRYGTPLQEDAPPRESLLAYPSLWRGRELLTLPPFHGAGARATLHPRCGEFFESIRRIR
ncbi:MAG: tRNA lysidine(34) synthetase TilS [Pseudomonadota bacterium]